MKKISLIFVLISSIFIIQFKPVLASGIEIFFKPQVTIPESEFKKVDGNDKEEKGVKIEASLGTLGRYIESIYNYLLAIVGILAALVLMVSGVIWLTAAGNSEKISQAKGLMTGSLTGLILALTSFIILQTINPYLVEFRKTNIRIIAETSYGCCKIFDNHKALTSIDCYEELLENKIISELPDITDKSSKELNNHIKNYFSSSQALDEVSKTCVNLVYFSVTRIRDAKKIYIKSTSPQKALILLNLKSNYYSTVNENYYNSAEAANKGFGVEDIELIHQCQGKRRGEKSKDFVLTSFELWCINGAGYYGIGGEGDVCGGLTGSVCKKSPYNRLQDGRLWHFTGLTNPCGDGYSYDRPGISRRGCGFSLFCCNKN